MYTYERATTTVSLSVMGKGSCFDGEETEPETFCFLPFFIPTFFVCVSTVFECGFGEWGKLLTLIAVHCSEFLHVLIPIPQSNRTLQSECSVF